MDDAFIFDSVRTPRGRGKQTGALHATKPISLLTGLLDALQDRNPGLDPSAIDDVVVGCVTPTGDQGFNIGRSAEDSEIQQEVELAVDRANQQLSRVEQIKHYAVLPDDWVPDSDELTPTMKLKRRSIVEKYATEIEALYS